MTILLCAEKPKGFPLPTAQKERLRDAKRQLVKR
jgi:hypothetical protein